MLRLISVRDGDRGAIAMIVAMLFGFGVMIGLAALTIDVGNINADRRQLQNGADAVALAFVQQCATNATCDPTVSNSSLLNLANTNAADGFTTISRVDGASGTPLAGKLAICGSMPNATNLLACPTTWVQSLTNLQECPASPPLGAYYVRVYTQTTMNAAGDHLLPYSFGAAIAGVGSGANQQACASVTVSQPSGAAAPIALSYCEWAAATGNNATTPVPGAGTYANPPIYADPPVVGDPGYGPANLWPTPAPQLPLHGAVGQEIIVALQGSVDATGCHTWNTHDAPGGFGYVSTTTSCNATAAVYGWIKADTGNTLPTSCASLEPYFNTVIYLPVFDCIRKVNGSDPEPTGQPAPTESCITGAGNVTWYHVMGYAKFYLSGYRTAGNGVAHIPKENKARTQTVTPQEPCGSLPGTSNQRCLSGWFLKGLVDTPPAPPLPPGAPSLGAYVVQLTG